MSRAPALALAALLAAGAAWAQSAPPDVTAAIDAEIASSRAAVDQARRATYGNAPLAERQAQTARDRGGAAIAAVVVEGIARYPGQANAIVSAATTRAPEARDTVLNAVRRAYPTFANAASAAAAPQPAAAAAPPARGGKREVAPAAPRVPPDVAAEIARAVKPVGNGAQAVAADTGNQELAQRLARYDDRQVATQISGTVVTAIARYPDKARDITAAAVAAAPQARDSIVAQATAAFPVFAAEINAGAANPAALMAAEEKPQRRVRHNEPVAPETIWDPIEGWNRGVFAVNDFVDTWFLRPVAKGYSYFPDAFKRSIGNFVSNLASPIVFVNDVLQAEVIDAGTTLGRFGVNMTVGVGGLFDPATAFGLPAHTADFGQTLHFYGWGPGPYLVLPLFGPNTARDSIGLAGDSVAHPLSILAPTVVTLSTAGVGALSKREALLKPLDDLKANSLDYYAAARSAYYQNRAVKLSRQVGTAMSAPAPAGAAAPPSNTEVDKLFDEAK